MKCTSRSRVGSAVWWLCAGVLHWVLAPVCALVLWLMGWKSIPRSDRDSVNRVPRAVVIYPHTSHWDYAVFAMYRFANLDCLGEFYTLYSKSYSSKWSWFLESTNCIAVNSKQRNQGQTDKLVELLKKKPRFKLFLSPKGSSKAANWRTGYFHLARKLDCPLMVCGLDYRDHCTFLFKGQIDPQLGLEETQKQLIRVVQNIHPLKPQNEPQLCLSSETKEPIHVVNPHLVARRVTFCVLLLAALWFLFLSYRKL